MAERDDAYWEGMSASIERGEYEVVGPVELGPAAAIPRGELDDEVQRMDEKGES